MTVLVDTEVLIWHLRGYGQATRRLDLEDTLALSAVSYLEVLQGIRSKAELAALKKMLERRSQLGLVADALKHLKVAHR